MEVEIKNGDCLDVLKKYKDNFFNLIITSPPYADRRSHTYGGIKPEKYIDWFLPRSNEFLRVLKPDGTFILNIKENVVNCERSTYVIKLILALRDQGWLWTEEFIWHKNQPMPGKWPNRFSDGFERCLQFNKLKKFNMYQDNVMIPIKNPLKKRNQKNYRTFNLNKSGFNVVLSNFVGRTMKYPSNVLKFPTAYRRAKHNASFPRKLPEWFIKLFTKENDWVLDPFVGGGTVLEVANNLGRNSVGIEIIKEYCEEMCKEYTKKPDLPI